MKRIILFALSLTLLTSCEYEAFAPMLATTKDGYWEYIPEGGKYETFHGQETVMLNGNHVIHMSGKKYFIVVKDPMRFIHVHGSMQIPTHLCDWQTLFEKSRRKVREDQIEEDLAKLGLGLE